jgi:hypothetical protein
MTISTYSVDSALQAYSRQSRMRIKTDSSPGGAGQRPSVDSVSITAEAANAANSNHDKPFYTLQEIISRKLIPPSGPSNADENTAQEPPGSTDVLS